MSGPPLAPELREALSRRGEADGFVPFDRFMETVLYAPGVGYYARATSPFGPDGDFYTAPRVHPVFAATVAARWRSVRRAVAGAGPFTFVDLGAGDGTLAAGVVRSLAEVQASSGLEVVLCDRAAARRASSVAAVRAVAEPLDVRVRAVASLAEVGPVAGLIVAHELLDAQPARRLRWTGEAWRELGFEIVDGRLAEAERPPLATATYAALPTLGSAAADTVVELSAPAEAIVREVADHLAAGLLAVFDFGAEEAELLGGHPHGTAAAVQAHRTLGSVADAPAHADLSVFVNFTRIRRAARAAGLVELAYRGQAEALGAWGLRAEVDRAAARAGSTEAEVRLRLAVKNLLFGFGTFHVLELAPPGSAGALAGLSEPAAAGPS